MTIGVRVPERACNRGSRAAARVLTVGNTAMGSRLIELAARKAR